MKHLWISIFISTISLAQTLNIPATVAVVQGQNVTVPVMLTGTTSNVVAFQNNLAISPILAFKAISAPTLTSKTYVAVYPTGVPATILICGITPVPPTVSGTTVTIPPADIFNNTPIPDGTNVEQIGFTIPTTAAIGTTYTLSLTNPIASDALGNPISINGSTMILTVTDFRVVATQSLNTWYNNQTPANFFLFMQALMNAVGH